VKKLYFYIFYVIMLLYFACLADPLLIRYKLWQIAKDVLSSEQITPESKSPVTYALRGMVGA